MFLQVAAPSFYDFIEKGSIILVLGVFVKYFMNELKAVRAQMDTDRKGYEARQLEMYERVIKVEEGNREVLNDVAQSNLLLTKAMNELTAQINKN